MATATKISKQCRNDFAGCSTGSVYYETKGHATSTFEEVLKRYDLCLSGTAYVDYNGPVGRASHPVCDDCGNEVGCAVFSWYRMPSGRYEFVGYLA